VRCFGICVFVEGYLYEQIELPRVSIALPQEERYMLNEDRRLKKTEED
jgi:hypothetical protein